MRLSSRPSLKPAINVAIRASTSDISPQVGSYLQFVSDNTPINCDKSSKITSAAVYTNRNSHLTIRLALSKLPVP